MRTRGGRWAGRLRRHQRLNQETSRQLSRARQAGRGGILTWPASRDGLILIGTGYAFFGFGGLVLYALGGGHIWYLFSSLVWLALGSIHLASAVARSRRER